MRVNTKELAEIVMKYKNHKILAMYVLITISYQIYYMATYKQMFQSFLYVSLNNIFVFTRYYYTRTYSLSNKLVVVVECGGNEHAVWVKIVYTFFSTSSSTEASNLYRGEIFYPNTARTSLCADVWNEEPSDGV